MTKNERLKLFQDMLDKVIAQDRDILIALAT